jgi:hypothetical protein
MGPTRDEAHVAGRCACARPCEREHGSAILNGLLTLNSEGWRPPLSACVIGPAVPGSTAGCDVAVRRANGWWPSRADAPWKQDGEQPDFHSTSGPTSDELFEKTNNVPRQSRQDPQQNYRLSKPWASKETQILTATCGELRDEKYLSSRICSALAPVTQVLVGPVVQSCWCDFLMLGSIRRARCSGMFRRFSDGVATSREGHRSPRSGPASRHRRWVRARWRRGRAAYSLHTRPEDITGSHHW